MQGTFLPTDIIKKSVVVFRSGDRRRDKAAILAMGAFLEYVEDGRLSLTAARATLADETKISSFIEKIRGEIKELAAVKKDQYEAEIRKLLTATHANSEKTLNGQDEMRNELKEILGSVHAELSKLNTVSTNLQQVSGDIISHTGEISRTTKKLVVDVGTAVKNTSTTVAVIVGFTVGFFSGIPSGMISNYLYERHFSKDAFEQAAPKQVAPAAAPPDPRKASERLLVPFSYQRKPTASSTLFKNPENPVLLKSGAYGARSVDTGKTMIELLKDGQTVLLPTQKGVYSVCLKPEAPLVCKASHLSR